MEARPGTQRHEETRGASASEARAWVPPRKQANTRQLPGFGDKARSKGAAGVCGAATTKEVQRVPQATLLWRPHRLPACWPLPEARPGLSALPAAGE